MSDQEREMTLNEAAAKVGIKPKSLWAAITRGKLKARQRGPMWFVTQEALEDWQKNRPHKPGRPPKT